MSELFVEGAEEAGAEPAEEADKDREEAEQTEEDQEQKGIAASALLSGMANCLEEVTRL